MEKEKMLHLAKAINKETDASVKEWMLDKFLEDLYRHFDNESVIYESRIVRNLYVNWDSNCGCTIVNASIDFEAVADYLLHADMEPTLDNASAALNDLGERTEYEGDVIDEDRLIDIDYLEELMQIGNESVGEDELVKDFERYVATAAASA